MPNIFLKLSLHILAAQEKSFHNRVKQIWYKDILVENRGTQTIAVVLKTRIFSATNNVVALNVQCFVFSLNFFLYCCSPRNGCSEYIQQVCLSIKLFVEN